LLRPAGVARGRGGGCWRPVPATHTAPAGVVIRALALGLLLAAGACAASAPAPSEGARGGPAVTAVGSSATVAGAPAAAPTPAVAPTMEPLKVAITTDAAMFAPHYLAIEKGYYAEEGLAVEIVKLPGGIATTALIAGELAYGTSTAAALNAALIGAPLKIILAAADRPVHEIWSTGPEVEALSDLPGKTLGVPSRGDGNEVAARIALMQHDIDPNSINWFTIGSGAQRLAAVQGGMVTAAVLPIADLVEMRETLTGGRRLVSLTDEVRLMFAGVVSSDQELHGQRERVRRFLRATAQGREYMKAYRAETLTVVQEYNPIRPAGNEIDYDNVIGAMSADGALAPEVQRRDAEVRASLNGVDTLPPIEQMYDFSVVREVYQELRARGWQPAR
jgi:ABC-type nitrate/sulfonate/bicarbonate transport system substrate-binding protein